MNELNLLIPGLPARYNANDSRHWIIRKKEADKWTSIVNVMVGKAKPAKPWKYANLFLVRASSRCPDYDGLVHSFKPVIDAIVKCGVLQDDKMLNIGAPSYYWSPVSKCGGHIWVRVVERNEPHVIVPPAEYVNRGRHDV